MKQQITKKRGKREGKRNVVFFIPKQLKYSQHKNPEQTRCSPSHRLLVELTAASNANK